MENFNQIIKIISDFGSSILLVGLLGIYLFNHFSNRSKEDDYELQRKKQRDDDSHEAFMRSLDLLSTMVVDKMKEDHFKEEPNNCNINNNIVESMETLLHKINASRVLHFSYHNGGKDYEGRSYQRMSCINEVVGDNVAPIQQKYNNVFRTSMFYIYKELNDNNFFNIKNIDDILKNDPGTHHMLAQDGTKSAFGLIIKNKKAETIGFIMVCFNETKEDIKEIITNLKKCAYQIEGIYLTL